MLPPLPAELAPPAPFPLIVSQSRLVEFVAPGIARATYRLQTVNGPLVINVVEVDPHEPSVRLGTVVADDRMISSGETVSSMATRTGAVAGVNADYFDIGNTNQPLNVVVRDGMLERTPSKRIALDVRTDGSVHLENWTFAGSASWNGSTAPLTTVNEWPPQGGVGFLSPAYGTIRAAPEVTVAELVPADVEHDAATIAGSYRVAAVNDVLASRAVTGPLLAFGPAAKALGALPAVGDGVTLATTTTPALGDVRSAVGGGPLLLHDGAAVDDPNAPAPQEAPVRFPVSGAGTTGDGTVLLTAVDGRAEQLSIGLTRPEYAALWLGFGAADAMAFDSGGSATLVARVLGDAVPSVLNAPSDGTERPVADGLFAYSDAPLGPPARLVARPERIVTLAHAAVPVRVAVVDAAGHALGEVPVSEDGTLRAAGVSEVRTLHARGVSGSVAFDVVTRLAHIRVSQARADVAPDSDVRLSATGIDDRSREVELGDAVRWSTDRGSIAADGSYRAADRDARIVAIAGGIRTEYVLAVGNHDVMLPQFGQPVLPYDFTGQAHSAVIAAPLALPGRPENFALQIRGDAGGAGVRAIFVNRYGERRSLWLTHGVSWTDWQPVRIALPDDLTPPVRLVSLSIVPPAGPGAPRGAGSLAFRNAFVTIAGRP